MLTRSLAFALCLTYSLCLPQRGISPRHRYPTILDFITQSLGPEEETRQKDQSPSTEDNPDAGNAANLQYGTFDAAENRQHERDSYFKRAMAKSLPKERSGSFWEAMQKRSLKVYSDPVCNNICQECSRWLTLAQSSLCWLDCQKGGHAFDQCITILSVVKNQE